MNVERILIVGGGIAGLTLAAALHQQGFTPHLVERSPTWQATGGGIGVQPNAMRVLRALGLGEAVEQAGARIRRWDMCDQQGEVLCQTDLEELWGDVGPFIGIARTRLQQVLREGAAVVPSQLGISLLFLSQNEHRVQVALSDGSVHDYDLVVGADGLASTVRNFTLSTDSPVYTGQMVWRSLAPTTIPGVSRVQFLLGEGCFFGLVPVGDGKSYGFGNVTGPRMQDMLDGRLARLRQRFAAFGGYIQQYLAALSSDEQIHVSPIEWLETERWYSGRVVLIGDAAHASSPMMGQGGCMAMEDAYVLAEVLRSAGSIEEALSQYVMRRKPRVSWVRQQSRAVAEGFDLPPSRRNAALRERGNQLMHTRFSPLISEP